MAGVGGGDPGSKIRLVMHQGKGEGIGRGRTRVTAV